jgi:hypothetical protein
MYDYENLIRCCRERENEERRRGFEAGPILLSRLSRLMERNFLPKLQELAWQHSQDFRSVSSVEEFDACHHRFVGSFLSQVKSRSGGCVSYGEAQQAVNVFLKEYVEKSQILPAAESSRLAPFLHVTLDGVVILYLQAFFRDDYLRFVASAANGSSDLPEPCFHKKDVSESSLRRLLFFDYEPYAAWQSWFRSIAPERPVLLDAMWSLARLKLMG